MKTDLRGRVSGRMLCLGIVAVGASVAVVAASPAGAVAVIRPDVGVGTLAGTGGLSPGLTTTPTPQQWIFGASGNVTDANPTGSGVYDCSFSLRSSIAETLAHGAGSGDGSCSGPLYLDLEGATYVRVGTDLAIYANFLASNGSSGHFVAECVYEPDSVPSYISYHLSCGISLEGLI